MHSVDNLFSIFEQYHRDQGFNPISSQWLGRCNYYLICCLTDLSGDIPRYALSQKAPKKKLLRLTEQLIFRKSGALLVAESTGCLKALKEYKVPQSKVLYWSLTCTWLRGSATLDTSRGSCLVPRRQSAAAQNITQLQNRQASQYIETQQRSQNFISEGNKTSMASREWIMSRPPNNHFTIEMLHFGAFLPERYYVTFGSLLSQFRLSVVCLSSVVCNIGAPYSGGWSFRQNFFTAGYAGILWPSCKILRR